jgi:hypothetical protein
MDYLLLQRKNTQVLNLLAMIALVVSIDEHHVRYSLFSFHLKEGALINYYIGAFPCMLSEILLDNTWDVKKFEYFFAAYKMDQISYQIISCCLLLWQGN